jgi:hypothetical protein
MDQLVNIIAIISLVAPAGVATGHAVIALVMPGLLGLGGFDAENGYNR